jgi:hypothetical protein
METLPREELERLVFFESAREQAEKEWSQNPRDTQVWRAVTAALRLDREASCVYCDPCCVCGTGCGFAVKHSL